MLSLNESRMTLKLLLWNMTVIQTGRLEKSKWGNGIPVEMFCSTRGLNFYTKLSTSVHTLFPKDNFNLCNFCSKSAYSEFHRAPGVIEIKCGIIIFHKINCLWNFV